MIAKLGVALGGIGVAALCIVGFAVILVFPYLIAVVFPMQSYRYTEIAAAIAVLIGIIALFAGFVRSIRSIAGVVMFCASWIVAAFLWVWSVILVDEIWGIVTLYVANFFLAVGAIVVAFFAILLTGRWGVLWQFVVIAAIATIMRVVGSTWAEAE